jgi:hypothetical protein
MDLATQKPPQEARRIGMTPEQKKIDTMRRVAWFLDARFKIPHTKIRFGLDQLVGLLPVGGDVAMGLLGVWMLVQARSVGISRRTRVRMGLNLIADVIIGATPIVGDIGDVFFKAHLRNMKLVEKELSKRKE